MKKLIVLGVLLALVSGCATQKGTSDLAVLRVGVSPSSKPLVFKQNNEIKGIEADFAELLGRSLGKDIRFIEVPWKKQIDALESDKIDIIMSGMTITPARLVRVDFTTPYMMSGMSALFRRDSYDATGLLASVLVNQANPVGYVKDTTGEFFVLQRFSRLDKKAFSSASAAVRALKSGKISMFVHDAPIVWWLSSQNESALISFPDVLNVESLAWGVSKDNTVLLDQINVLLGGWAEDGTSRAILKKWISYLD